MKVNIRIVTSCVSLGLSVASLVLLVISKEPDLKTIVMLLALGMAAMAISLVDQLGEKSEENTNDQESEG